MRLAAIIIVSLVVLAVGTVGVLMFTGVIKIGGTKPAQRVKYILKPGEAFVPVSFKDIPANTEITRELLINPRSGELVTQPIVKDVIQGKGIMTNPAQIIGRVLKHEKHPGYMFSEGDFYPKKTKPGPTAAIPPGYRGVTFLPAKLLGSRILKPGDHVDIMSAQKYDPSSTIPPSMKGSAVALLHPKGVHDSVVKVLARDAVVITAANVELVPTKIQPNGKTVNKVSEAMLIAVDVRQVPDVIEAMASGAEMSSFPHSSQPDPNDSGLPTPPAIAVPTADPIVTIETVRGGKKSTVVFSSDTQPAEVTDPTTLPSLVPPPPSKPIPVAPPTSQPSQEIEIPQLSSAIHASGIQQGGQP